MTTMRKPRRRQPKCIMFRVTILPSSSRTFEEIIRRKLVVLWLNCIKFIPTKQGQVKWSYAFIWFYVSHSLCHSLSVSVYHLSGFMCITVLCVQRGRYIKHIAYDIFKAEAFLPISRSNVFSLCTYICTIHITHTLLIYFAHPQT